MILLLAIVAVVLLAPLIWMMVVGNWAGILLLLIFIGLGAALISFFRRRFDAASLWLIAASGLLMGYAAHVWHTVAIPWEWYVWVVVAIAGTVGTFALWYTSRVIAGAAVFVVTLFLVTGWDIREVPLGWGILVAVLVIAAIVLAILRLYVLAFVALAIAVLIWLLVANATWQWWVVATLVLAAILLLVFVATKVAIVIAIIAVALAVVLGLLASIGLLDWGKDASPENFTQGPTPSAGATTGATSPPPTTASPSPTSTSAEEECPDMYVQRPIERTGNSYIRGGINGLLGENGTKASASEKLDAYLRVAGEDALLLAAYSAPTIPQEWPDPNNEGDLLNYHRDCLSERGQVLHTSLTNVWEAATVMNVDMPDNGYLSGIVKDGDDELVVVAFRTGIPQGRRGIQITLADESRTIYIDDATGAVIYLSQPGNIPVDSGLDPKAKPTAKPTPTPKKTKPKSSSSTGGDKGEGGSSGSTSTGSSSGSGTTSVSGGSSGGGSGGSVTGTPAPKPTSSPSPTSTPAVTRTTTVPAPVTATTTIPAP